MLHDLFVKLRRGKRRPFVRCQRVTHDTVQRGDLLMLGGKRKWREADDDEIGQPTALFEVVIRPVLTAAKKSAKLTGDK